MDDAIDLDRYHEVSVVYRLCVCGVGVVCVYCITVLLQYFAGENSQKIDPFAIVVFWLRSCVITQSLGFAILFFKLIDQPSQSLHMFDARKTF